jgi:probable phosphomutase (TIGR03848 family)
VAIVLLLRHGHSTANEQGVLAGWTPGVGLTERGREQAGNVAHRLRPLTIARAVSSPLQRCAETAAIALAGHDVGLDDRLGECHYGAWTGLPLAEAATQDLWRVVQDDPEAATFPPHDRFRAESLRAMADRVVGAVRSLDAEVEAAHGTDAVWVAVSHGDPIKAVVAEAVGAGLSGLQRVRVDPGSLSAVHITPTRMVLLASNTAQGDLQALLSVPRHTPAGDSEVGGGSGGATA